MIVAQHQVRQYNGRDIYIYVAPGEVIDLRWKIMNFNNDREDVIQYYYVNGNPLKRQDINSLASITCFTFSYLYIVFGNGMKWFKSAIFVFRLLII